MSDYTVNIADRVKELFFEHDAELGSQDHVTYEWLGGYETVRIYRENGDISSEYRGVYHPDGHCDTGSLGPGVCYYCGKTWH